MGGKRVKIGALDKFCLATVRCNIKDLHAPIAKLGT